MSRIISKIIAAAGGELWRRPSYLHLSGHAWFTPLGKPSMGVKLNTYEMYRVFPQQNIEAHAANGKVRFDAFAGIRWIDVRWTNFEVNEAIADEVFSVKATT